jgi:hypothetical protein
MSFAIRSLRVASVTTLVALVGCAGRSIEAPTEGGTSDSPDGIDSGNPFDGGNPVDGTPPSDDSPTTETGPGPGSPCPSSPPSQDQACSPVGLYCEYDVTSPNPFCNDLWQCQSSGWSQLPEERCPVPPPPSTCPASYASVPVSHSCTSTDQICQYPTGTCICSPDPGGLPTAGGPTWECIPLSPGCPSPVPAPGSACSTPGLSCDYGACSGGVGLECTDGYWSIAMTACPA